MTCLGYDLDLSAHLDGELSAVEERRLLDHLAVCPTCRAARDELVSLSRAIQGADNVPSFSAAKDFEEKVVRRAGRVRRRRKPLPRLRFPFGRVAAAALFLVVTVVSAAYLAGAVPAEDPGNPVLLPDRASWSGALEESRERLEELGLFVGPDVTVIAGHGSRGEAFPPLPELPLPRENPAVAAGDDRGIYEKLGLKRVGENWLSKEAYQRVREHREQERLLARTSDLRARERAVAASTPTRAEENAVVTFLGSLTAGESVKYDDITVIPVLDGHGNAGVEVLEVRDALRRRILRIREDRTTARLTAVNTDPDRYVFLPAGAILVGGHADRMVTRATLIPPNSKASLPVLCCERGRYIGPRDTFVRMVGIAPPEIRGLLLGAVNQEEVWARIDEVLTRLGARNRTHALREIFTDGRGPEAVRKHTAGLRGVFRDERSVGFLVFEEGRFVGGEIFASHSVLEAEGGQFVVSHILGRAGRDPGKLGPISGVEANAVLAAVGRASFFPTPGAVGGQESEFVSEKDAISGTALIPVAGASPLHVFLNPGIALPAGAGRETGSDTRVGRPPVNPDDGSATDDPRVRRRIEDRRRHGTGPRDIDPPEHELPNIPGREEDD